MIGNKRILAIIPARGGSKRLPGKNIKPLAGKPLIAWTIDAALKSKYIDRVVVSTDSIEIADVALKFGGEVDMRPEELATDTSTSDEVIKYVVEKLESQKKFYDYVILLQPTSPLRTVTCIDSAFDKMISKNKKAVVSMSRCEHSPLLSNILPADESLSGFLPKHVKSRSQDNPTYYRINGAIYIFSREFVGNIRDIYCNEGIAYISPCNSGVDIDTETDFKYVEFLVNGK